MTALDGVNGTVCNAEQYQQSLFSYNGPNSSISCLTHGQSIGLALTAEASLLSFVCVLAVFIRIAWNVGRYGKTISWGDRHRKLFQVPADVYMFSLFVFDILQAWGGILDVRWAHNGIVTTGPYCTAQGIIQQVGELGVALVILILAVHTFVVSLWGIGLQAASFALVPVSLACIFIAVWIYVGAGTHKNYEVPTPYWCWINPQFSSQRLAGEYIWLWMALFASAILYVPLYFWAEGHLSVDTEKWYKFHVCKPDQGTERAQRKIALGMLLYPFSYCLIILPLSVARWLQFRHVHVPSAATFFGVSMFNLSGAVNVLVFLIARPGLLLFTRPRDFDETHI